MKKIIVRTLLSLVVLTVTYSYASSQSKLDSLLPVRGFCIALPTPEYLDEFVNFINTELAPRNINTLVLRVEYKYKFKSHPELIDTLALSKREVRKIVRNCKKNNIQVIPLIDMLGHQSGSRGPGKLLKVYPQFDETPAPKVPDTTKVFLNGFNMKVIALYIQIFTLFFLM